MTFLFHKNVLVGTGFTSSFKSDSTYFDPEAAKSIKKGMTEREVIAKLGRPGGEYRYPIIERRDGRALVYAFTKTVGFRSQQALLTVELNKNGKVVKTSFSQAGQL